MTILVVGATGATGRLLVQVLIDRGQPVRAVVRTPEKLPAALRDHRRLTIVQATLLDLGDEDLLRLVGDCRAVVSCLGHSLSLQGIYGSPRRLVTDATRRLCEAIRATRPQRPVRFVLMNAAEYLRTQIGRNDGALEWTVVRPDTLIDEASVTDYAAHPSPTRSAIFDAGKTSRINVARFMADLITSDDVWCRWRGQMPVIYNEEFSRQTRAVQP